MEDNSVKGCRALIAAILNQAIVDGISYKRPRPDQVSVNLHKKYKKRLNQLYLTLIFLNKFEINNHFKFLILIKISNLIKKYLRKYNSFKRELLAFEGRSFINKENTLFKNYCYLLDMEPEYLEKKIYIYFKNFDNGLCSKLSKIEDKKEKYYE